MDKTRIIQNWLGDIFGIWSEKFVLTGSHYFGSDTERSDYDFAIQESILLEMPLSAFSNLELTSPNSERDFEGYLSKIFSKHTKFGIQNTDGLPTNRLLSYVTHWKVFPLNELSYRDDIVRYLLSCQLDLGDSVETIQLIVVWDIESRIFADRILLDIAPNFCKKMKSYQFGRLVIKNLMNSLYDLNRLQKKAAQAAADEDIF